MLLMPLPEPDALEQMGRGFNTLRRPKLYISFVCREQFPINLVGGGG